MRGRPHVRHDRLGPQARERGRARLLVEVEQDHVARAHAGWEAVGRDGAAQQDAGHDEQQRAHGDLTDDESPAQASGPEGRPELSPRGLHDVGSGRLQRGCEPKDERRRDARQQHEGEHPQVGRQGNDT